MKHFDLHPKYSRPKIATLRAGIASNRTKSIAREMKLLTSQSLLIEGLATWAKAIR